MSQRQEFHSLDNPDDGVFPELALGLTACIFASEHAMILGVAITPGCIGTPYHHPEEHGGVLLGGRTIRSQGGEEIAVRKGDVWRTPGSVPHTLRAGPEGGCALDIFASPRPEYRNAGKGLAA